MYDMDKIDAALKLIEKPARYSGGELNMRVKDPKAVDVRFCLAFPDTYEVGMSHLGSRILYGLLNGRSDVYCERCYAPWVDMEAQMRENSIPLFSLETRAPLAEFDIIGFSLLYEMSYTNLLNMLELAGIPQRSKDRGEEYPLVVAGGPCACNPEPLAPFIDLFMVGDGEEVIGELVDAYKLWKKEGGARQDFLKRAARIPGVYVPSLYDVEYNENGTVKSVTALDGAPEKISRRIVEDFDSSYFPVDAIVPYISIVHDRITLELFRGCTRGCRFCQAGFIYRPVRERGEKRLLEQACAAVKATGYEEMSLSSLSSGDYPQLSQLITDLMDEFSGKRVSFSLPSLRIDSFARDYAEKMQSVRKSTLTFAPEAGTQRLRDVINKGVTEQDLINSVTDAFESGWNSVKLYFMIGLPTETDEDLDGMVDLAKKVGAAYYSVPREHRQKGLRIAVSVASFVPKPFTPFGWEPQNTIEELERKQKYLREKFRGVRGVEFNYHSPNLSSLEAVMARGDRRIAEVIYAAWKRGCRFDSWNDCFKYDEWTKAFEDCKLDKAFYAYRRRGDAETLPYDHIYMHVRKDYLLKERDNALAAAVTKDCRKGCNGCFDKDSMCRYCKQAERGNTEAL